MLFSIDEKDSRPFYLQLANQVKEQVSSGMLKPGDVLPSVRELAESLHINLHTVRSAYLKLRDEGVIDLRLGRKARITHRPSGVSTGDVSEELVRKIRELVADALVQGLSPEDIRYLINEQLAKMARGGD